MEQKKKPYIPRYIQQYIKDAERYMAFSALKKTLEQQEITIEGGKDENNKKRSKETHT